MYSSMCVFIGTKVNEQNDVDGPTNSRRKTDKRLTDLRSTGMKYTSIMCVCIHFLSTCTPSVLPRAARRQGIPPFFNSCL